MRLPRLPERQRMAGAEDLNMIEGLMVLAALLAEAAVGGVHFAMQPLFGSGHEELGPRNGAGRR